jgi:hypothetical protein
MMRISQIWSMKKAESDAAKKKPKTSAAQIRVQKGVHKELDLMLFFSASEKPNRFFFFFFFVSRFDGTRAAFDYDHTFP